MFVDASAARPFSRRALEDGRGKLGNGAREPTEDGRSRRTRRGTCARGDARAAGGRARRRAPRGGNRTRAGNRTTSQAPRRRAGRPASGRARRGSDRTRSARRGAGPRRLFQTATRPRGGGGGGSRDARRARRAGTCATREPDPEGRVRAHPRALEVRVSISARNTPQSGGTRPRITRGKDRRAPGVPQENWRLRGSSLTK